MWSSWAFQVALLVKSPPANAGDARDWGSIPGSERSPGGGYGNPLQYSCLEKPMDRGAWWATVHGVTKNWTRLKQLGMQHVVLLACVYWVKSLLIFQKFSLSLTIFRKPWSSWLSLNPPLPSSPTALYFCFCDGSCLDGLTAVNYMSAWAFFAHS